MKFNNGDWVIFDLSIGQIDEIEESGYARFCDGSFETYGRILSRCRPLTMENKQIVESVDYIYKNLKSIDGERGFNYPRISDYFYEHSLYIMDNKDTSVRSSLFQKLRDFVTAAREYKPLIDGVKLFSSNR